MCIRFALAGELRRAKTVCSRFGTKGKKRNRQEENFEAVEWRLIAATGACFDGKPGTRRIASHVLHALCHSFADPASVVETLSSRGTAGDEWIRRLISNSALIEVYRLFKRRPSPSSWRPDYNCNARDSGVLGDCCMCTD